jgi:MFS family permease
MNVFVDPVVDIPRHVNDDEPGFTSEQHQQQHERQLSQPSIQKQMIVTKTIPSSATSADITTTTTTTTTTASSSTNVISNIPLLLCSFIASATTGGTSYAFGLYAATLKHNLHLSQGELDSISTSFFIAGLFSFIPGLCSDMFGTKVALSLGGCLGASSLLLYWCVAREFIPILRKYLVAVLSGLGIITFLSCALVTGAIFKIIVSSTGSGNKGSAVGVAKGFVGLGAGLYACIFQSIQATGQSDLDFLPMAAFLFVLCATIPALVLLPSKQQFSSLTVKDDCTPLHFRTLYCSLVILAVIILSSTMIKLYEKERNAGSTGRSYGMAFILTTVWLGPIMSLYILPRNEHEYDAVATTTDTSEHSNNDEALFNDNDIRQQYHDDSNIEADVLQVTGSDPNDNTNDISATRTTNVFKKRLVHEERTLFGAPSTRIMYSDIEDCNAGDNRDAEVVGNVDDNSHKHLHHPEQNSNIRSIENDKDSENLNLLQMIQTPTSLLLLWTTILLVGGGTVETNNMGQMVESLHFHTSITSTALTFFSVAQAASRVLTGVISEAALTCNTNLCCIQNGIPRPFFMVIASLIGFIAHLVLGIARTELIFVFGVTLSGIAFGMVWPLMVLISAEVFGVERAGQNYMFYDGVSSAGGTLLISKFVAQAVYDHNTDPNGTDSKTCIGMDCFQSTHMIVSALCLTCALTSLIMMYTSRHSYNKPILHAH